MRDDVQLVRFPLDGINWLVAEQDRERLLAASRTGWEGQVQRLIPGRRVIWIEGKAGPVLLKHFQAQGVKPGLKGLLRGSPASQEWTALQKARRLGLPVPRPVALGVRKGVLRHESFLVTEALDGALPLQTVLFGERSVRGRRRWDVIRAAAGVLRRMHDAGVSQGDLHLGNMLARPGVGADEVFLIDLQRAQVGARVREAIRWRDLAILHGGCREASLTDRLRFLKAYLAGPPPMSTDLKSLVAHLERRGLRHRFHVWQRRRWRCVAENQEFCPVQIGGFTGFARRASWNTSLQILCEEPECLLARPGVHLLKDSRTTTVGLIPSPSGSLFVKRYNYQGLGYAFKDLFRHSRARRVWIAGNSLRMRGIPTPLPYAYLERRRFGILLQSYLITERVEGVGLLESCGRFGEAGASFQEKWQVARESATLLRTLHERGVSHRDLKAQNILVGEELPRRFRPLLVDLDGVRLGRVGRRRRIRDLARFARSFRDQSAVTRTDRVRFLQTYAGPRGKPSWKKVWENLARIESRAHQG
ncbi:MAG: lipopolysaccharide kinase InaA family protein [Candidatus Methylomirabilales bacterium]|nr:hypothetical protein [candidate division NC10 bacterium]